MPSTVNGNDEGTKDVKVPSRADEVSDVVIFP